MQRRHGHDRHFLLCFPLVVSLVFAAWLVIVVLAVLCFYFLPFNVRTWLSAAAVLSCKWLPVLFSLRCGGLSDFAHHRCKSALHLHGTFFLLLLPLRPPLLCLNYSVQVERGFFFSNYTFQSIRIWICAWRTIENSLQQRKMVCWTPARKISIIEIEKKNWISSW